MTSGDGPVRPPGRRAVLLASVVALLDASVAACTRDDAPTGAPTSPSPSPPSADELAASRAAVAARDLLALEAGLATAAPPLAPLVSTLATAHRAHLAALGLPDAVPSPSSPSPPPSRPSRTGSPSTVPVSANTVVRAERTAATQALTDVVGTTPATAGLLARIAAARAVHADLLAVAAGLRRPGPLTAPAPSSDAADPRPSSLPPSGSSGSSSGSSSSSSGSPSSTTLSSDDATALDALLAGEHAAVFAYGLITARAPSAAESTARDLWEAHRARRDELERRLVDAGRTPVAAEPAYDLGTPPATAALLSALAARVEDGLAAAALRAVTGGAAGAVRAEAAEDLVRAARRAAAWRGSGVALPGGPS